MRNHVQITRQTIRLTNSNHNVYNYMFKREIKGVTRMRDRTDFRTK